MSNNRVFEAQYLEEAGRLTVDLLDECLQKKDAARAEVLLVRLQEEVLTMYYSYRGWEKAILKELTAQGGEEESASAVAAIEDESAAPERMVKLQGVTENWTAEIEQCISALKSHDVAAIGKRSRNLYEHALTVHDGMMSRITALLSILQRGYGEDVLMKVLQKVMRPDMMDPDGTLPFKEKVEKIIHFTRVHLQPFKMREDDEKVTFLPDPCPSGGRLAQEGHYEAPRNGAYVSGPAAITYGRENLPVYCCHEPAMELGSILKNGAPIFLVDPAEEIGKTPCQIHVYKDPQKIPEKYYQRLGLNRAGDLIASS